MAIDMAALKARLEKMNNAGKGGQKKYRSDLWTPDYGKYSVRAAPWPEEVEVGDTAPFIERWFYYGLGKRVIARPLGEPDPVRELRDHLFSDRTEANLSMARELKPKMRCFLPVIVEATEDDPEDDVKTGDKIVKIWGISQTVYKKLLGYIVDPDYGDITDVSNGYDLTVDITDSGKKFGDGRPIKDIDVRPRPKPRELDKAEKELLKKIPDINSIYPLSTYEQLEEALNKFINGGPTGAPEQRGGQSQAASNTGGSGGTKPKTGGIDDAFDDLLNV